nr:hypothetical protein [Tanacetum cinerariifolium]
LARKDDSHTSFNELMDTPLDFSAFVMNWLKVDTLTPELLAGLTYELMKRSCKSLVELEFFLEEVYKATTDQLDWNNPKGSINSKKAISKGFVFKTLKTCCFSWFKTIWRRSDKYRAAAMMYAIDKQLKTRRIMGAWRSLLVEYCTRETFGYYKGLYDLSYVVLIIKAWKGSLVEDSMRETFDCYKGPYDSSYAAPIFNVLGGWRLYTKKTDHVLNFMKI